MIDMIKQHEARWRSAVASCCGGEEFDKPGGGYSFSNVLAEERQLMLENKPGDPDSALCCLSIADPTGKMPAEAFAEGERYYRDNWDSTRYTDLNGIPGTHQRIAEYLCRNYSSCGIVFTPEWIQYSPGSIKRMLGEYLPALLFETGTELVFPSPGYGVMKDPINLRLAVLLDMPLMVTTHGKWLIDYDSVEKRIMGRKRVMYLNIPQNPVGVAYTEEEWANTIAWANRNRVILVVDEAYIHLLFGKGSSVLDIPGWETCCIVLQSVSKGWNATGLRFGWAVAHPTVIKALRKVMDVKDSGGFGPSIASGLWCIKHEGFAANTCLLYKALHQSLFSGLQDSGFQTTMPDAGLCQFTRAPRSANGTVFQNATECAQWFRKELRISLMHSTVAGDAWLRWAVTIIPIPECGLPDEKTVIEQVVKRLKSVKFEF